MTCAEVKGLVDSWQESGATSERDYAAMTSHVSECEGCRVRYARLLLLMARDGGLRVSMVKEPEASDGDFTSAVMDRIKKPVSPFSRGSTVATRRRLMRLAGVAAAAVVLIAVGFVLRPAWAPTGRDEVLVHFVLDAPGATQVALVGSFNGWDPDALPLKRDRRSSRWEISVPLKRGETYLYNFVVNGRTWIPDPATEAQVTDGFGGESSLIQL